MELFYYVYGQEYKDLHMKCYQRWRTEYIINLYFLAKWKIVHFIPYSFSAANYGFLNSINLLNLKVFLMTSLTSEEISIFYLRNYSNYFSSVSYLLS